MKVYRSLGSYPRRPFFAAAAQAVYQPAFEPLFGQIGSDHLQLCPQNLGVLSELEADQLLKTFPQCQFRLHANVRVSQQRKLSDLVEWDNPEFNDEWHRLAAISKRLRAPAYTLHAGRRTAQSFKSLLSGLRYLEDLFDCPVGVEGHYPTQGHPSRFFLDSWAEYSVLLESGFYYVVDLSHLKILAHQTKHLDLPLVRELLRSNKCLEVHFSDNDGKRDQHAIVKEPQWWSDVLSDINKNAVCFSEGIQQ